MKLTPVQKEVVELLRNANNIIIYIAIPVKMSGHAVANREGQIIKRIQYRTFKSLLENKVIEGRNQNQYFILSPNFK